MKKTILTLVIAMVSVFAFAENKTVKLYIPSMECSHCQEKVEDVLNYEKGVKKLTADLSKRMVTIVYDDSKTNVKTLQESLLKNLKFKSQEIKTSEQEAKLAEQSKKSQCNGKCDHDHDHDHNHSHGHGEKK